MTKHTEAIELFRALEVTEVEARAQHTLLATNIGSSSSNTVD